jgi:chromosome segregation protein
MLKSLELAGFKSFADRTRLEFSRGVTAVVGPNGSGKSNVVDAMKWVLGSQSAKSLRGGEMTDVIFNGSASRRALHAAEVTLTLDNASGLFALEAPEVALTRRVYRSGESEYLINRQPCRLKDIRELLAGTGVGTEAYSIIEQGKVDALLQASTHQRRAIFEEAAGISRFRGKRQEALRRLQRVDQNLLRLSDIVDEVETRLRSIRAQAGKAETFRQQSKRLEQLRTALGLVDWLRLTRQLDAATSRLAQVEATTAKQRELVTQAETHLPELETQIDQLDNQLADLDKQFSEHSARRVKHQLLAGQHRSTLARLQVEQVTTQGEWLAYHCPDSTEPTADLPDVDALVSAIDHLAARYRELSEAVEYQQRSVRSLRDQRDAVASRLAAARERRESLKVAADTVATKLDRQRIESQQATEQAEQCKQQQPTIEQALATAQSQLAQAEHAVEQGDARRRELQSQIAAADARVAELRERAHETATQLARIEQRWEIVGELQRRRDARQHEVALFLAERLGHDAQHAPTVAELLSVDIDMASMIEAALGSAAQHVVLDSLEHLAQHVQSADNTLTSRTTFAAAKSQGIPSRLELIDLAGEPGVMGRADEFVDTPPEYELLVKRLLGRTWFVDTLPHALALARGPGRGLRFVTIAGEVLGDDGSITLGPVEADWHLLGDGEQLRDLREQLDTGSIESRQQFAELAEAESALAVLRQTIDHEATAQDNQVKALVAAQQQLRQAQSQLEVWQHQLQTTTAAATAAHDLCDELSRRCRKANTELAEFTEQIDSVAAGYNQLCQQNREADDQLQSLAVTLREVEVEQARAEQRLVVARQQTLHSDGHVTSDADERLTALQTAIESEQLAVLSAESIEAISAWHCQQLGASRQQLSAQRTAVRQRRQQIVAALQETRRQIDQQMTQRQELQVSATRIESQRETLADRLREDYGIDVATAAATADQVELPGERDDVEREIETLRKSINRIGAVNTDALDELNDIEERFNRISAQYNDLSQAKESLERLITRLNNDSRQLFFDTIETVRGHFQELFRRLFGGGNADLVVEESQGDDPLECGIEIQACPPGKDTRSISLLSGGERTLTCVALLLAMFRSKPSPFCVLDEVDAALDEANIGRFTKVIGEFLSNTQFIVITHSKKTMTGADTLYGITMQESGISKQVSVRFDDVADDGTIRSKPAETKRAA